MLEKSANFSPDILLSYDGQKRMFKHVMVIDGNVVNGTWPIYNYNPQVMVNDVIARIVAQIQTIKSKDYPRGQSKQDEVFAQYRKEGIWFTPDEMRQYLKG
jgi:hypothetical protein